jgi:hypothetical protein
MYKFALEDYFRKKEEKRKEEKKEDEGEEKKVKSWVGSICSIETFM